MNVGGWTGYRIAQKISAEAGLPADHQTFIPPSTTISTPVTYELSSEARNNATFATPAGRKSCLAYLNRFENLAWLLRHRASVKLGNGLLWQHEMGRGQVFVQMGE